MSNANRYQLEHRARAFPRTVLATTALLALVFHTTACNPGQCLRQSDCPLGSTCKKSLCRVSANNDDGTAPSASTSATTSRGADETVPNSSGLGGTVSIVPESQSSNSPVDAAADAASSAALSANSSNLDAVTDTATTPGL